MSYIAVDLVVLFSTYCLSNWVTFQQNAHFRQAQLIYKSLRGRPDDMWRGLRFFPLWKLFFFAPNYTSNAVVKLLQYFCGYHGVRIVAPNQKQTFFFPLRQRNKQIFFPDITPLCCPFCEQTFIFYSLLNKVCFITFCWTIFSFSKNPSPPPHISFGQPLNNLAPPYMRKHTEMYEPAPCHLRSVSNNKLYLQSAHPKAEDTQAPRYGTHATEIPEVPHRRRKIFISGGAGFW